MDDFRVDGWLVAPGRNTISQGTRVRKLEPRVMDLLAYLASHPNQVLSRDQILSNVWPHRFVSDSALETAVSALRRAFGDDRRHPRVLETIPKRGYRLIAPTTAARPLIAVLPFDNLTGDPEQTYLADGITDLLIGSLGQYRVLRVLSRHSSMALRERSGQPEQIAAELGLDYLVEGSISSFQADQAAAVVRLIDPGDGTCRWSHTGSVMLADLVRWQSDVALHIVGEVCAEPDVDPIGHPEGEISAAALDDFLRGRFHFYKFSPEQFPRAIACFESAIERSPDFAAAHAAIADVWGAYGYWGVRPASQIRAPLREALDRCRQLAPGSAEARMLEGAYRFHCLHDWQGSRQYLELAIATNPSLAHAHILLALVLGTLRDPAALNAADAARQLDPLAPPVGLARALCLAGRERFAEADAEVTRMLELNPVFRPALELAADLLWLRADPRALDAERRVWAADTGMSASLAGQDPEAAFIAAAACLQQRAETTYVSPRVLARQLSLSGRTEDALSVLEDAIAAGDLMQIDFVQMAPSFATARRTPRFARLAAGIGLPVAD